MTSEFNLRWVPQNPTMGQVVRLHQAITWANVDSDLCRHMASLGHNDLIRPF